MIAAIQTRHFASMDMQDGFFLRKTPFEGITFPLQHWKTAPGAVQAAGPLLPGAWTHSRQPVPAKLFSASMKWFLPMATVQPPCRKHTKSAAASMECCKANA